MKTYFMDLHVHIGRSGDGEPVKITASPRLTLENILAECLERKGIGLVGVVDCASPGVLRDLEGLMKKGELKTMPKGGLRYRDSLTLYTGVEMEAKEASGRHAHYLAYFPGLTPLRRFASYLWRHVKNPELSTQACHLSARELLNAVLEHEGVFLPAHAFTPHKSLFGTCATSLQEVFGEDGIKIIALELGLSADSSMASCLPGLEKLVLLSNSDAHSLEKIGREYNHVVMNSPDFAGLKNLLSARSGCRVLANYGLDPRLGKYHRSYCNKCKKPLYEEGPVLKCPHCSEQRDFVTGVLDRILYLSRQEKGSGFYPVPYHYQVPLSFLPGLGKRITERLLSRFSSEMNVLHLAKEAELAEVVGKEKARLIIRARQGELSYLPGAGGVYGQINRE